MSNQSEKAPVQYYNSDVALTGETKKKPPEKIQTARRNRFIYYLTTGPEFVHDEKFRARSLKASFATPTTVVRERLSVANPPDERRTIVDLDPDFYTIVEGRPLKNGQSVKEYTEELKECALAALLAAHSRDETFANRERRADELGVYARAKRAHNECAAAFEKLLDDSQANSHANAEEARESRAESLRQIEEGKRLDVELGKAVRKLYDAEEKIRLAKTYRNFLEYVSPLPWHREKNIDVVKVKREIDEQKRNLQDEFPSLPDLMRAFEESREKSAPPELYFAEPRQMLDVLKSSETQNLTNWSNSEAFAKNAQTVHTSVRHSEDAMQRQLNNLRETVERKQREIDFEESYNAKLKEQVLVLLNSGFFETVSSENKLMIKVGIEHLYKKIVFPNITFETYEMMKALELEYELSMIKLDNINLESVQSEKQFAYAEDIKIMQQAKDAAKRLKNLERLFKELNNGIQNT